MSTPNKISVLNNLEISLLTDWNDVSRVRQISKGCYFMQDVESLNIGFGAINSKSLDTNEYRESYIGDGERVAEIQNVAVIGNTLVIDLNPINGNPVDFYREGDRVFADKEQIQAIVIQTAPGQIVVEPFAGSTINSIAGSFSIGDSVCTIGNALPIRNSSSVVGLNRMPDIQMNYLVLMRDGAQWNRVDMRKARVKWGGDYWSSGMVNEALDRMLKDIERSWFWGLPQATVNDVSSNGGVDWAIRNRGGEVVQFAALPTKRQFLDWLGNVYDKRPGSTKLKKLYMGRRFYQYMLENFGVGFAAQIDPQAPRTGENNENFNRWMVGGFEVDLVTNLPMFQERDYRPQVTTIAGAGGLRKEWSCYLIDQDPIMIAGGGTVPAIEKLHFGDSPFYIGRSNGIGDCPVGMPTADGQLGNPDSYELSTSAVDRSELHFMYHGGVNMATGEFSGIFEAAL